MTIDSPIVALIPTTTAYATASLTSSIISSPSSPLALSLSSSSPSVSHVIAFTADRTFRLLDLQLTRIVRYIGAINFAKSVAVLDAAGRVAVLSEQSVFIWRLDTWTCERTVDARDEVEAERAIIAEERAHSAQPWLSEEKERGAVCQAVWSEPQQQRQQPAPMVRGRRPSCACPLWSSAYVACGTSEGFVHLWRVGVHSSMRRMTSVRAHHGTVTSVQYATERRLVSCGSDSRVRLWQIAITDRSGATRPTAADSRWWEDDDVDEQRNDHQQWSLQLLFEYDTQSTAGSSAAALFVPGD